jgi:hypothetical protein
MEQNHWVSAYKREYGTWFAKFPGDRMLDHREMLAFLQEVFAVGEQEAVLRVLETSKPHRFQTTPDLSYSQFLNQLRSSSGEKLLGFGVLLCPDEVQARLCYYETDGQLVEAEVSWPGLLLRRLRPEYVEDWEREYMYPWSPMELGGGPGTRREDGRVSNGYLSITLHTDIWFPIIRGTLDRLEWDWDLGEEPEWFNNRELAHCHTPRFNRFLRKVKQLTLEFGGTWKLDDAGVDSLYKEQLTEEGIRLED